MTFLRCDLVTWPKLTLAKNVFLNITNERALTHICYVRANHLIAQIDSLQI
jgi:hypothetical protein